MEALTSENSIKKCYENSEIFITGATGFLGRVLTEKILRSCAGVKKVYLLLREKKGVAAKDRIEQLTNCKVS
jgi:fatty acyl-CoA reductase